MGTYFFDYKDAYKEARKQNKFTIFNNLQICYYNGEHKVSPYPNLMGVPLGELCDYLSETPNRGISEIKFINSFSKLQQEEVLIYIDALQQIAWQKKNDIGSEYRKALEEQKPDFSEPLRILFITTRITTVLQYVAKNLADAFNDLGYSTFVSIEQNAMQSWGGNDSHGNAEFAWHLKNIYEYNPHIIFNLDWINNTFLNEAVFNFVWFQDPMPILYDDKEIVLREKDYIFTLFDEFKEALIKKGVEATKIMPQQFATNPKIFFRDESIKKENKIVFLGSDYGFEKDLNISDEMKNKIYDDIENNRLNEEDVMQYAKDANMDENYFRTSIITSFVRRRVVIWMCMLEGINIEVYGTDAWLQNPEVVPYYKGLLPYGEEMAKVYNSATYALSVHPQYRYQQRVFEISACGTIPLIYNCSLIKEEFFHEDNILSFSTLDELKGLIGQIPKKDPKEISEDISFEKMAKKIINIVENNIREEN